MSTKNSYRQPIQPTQGYSFVAAGALWKNFAGYCVYVKYKPGPKIIKIKQKDSTYCWFECPDREIVIVKNSYDSDTFIPWGSSFDECTDFSLYNDQVCKNLGIEYIMTNYVHSPSSKHVRLTTTLAPEERIQVMSDSGGLQLIRGVKDLIHPKDLIEFYNNNVDAGMVLDLPLHFSDLDLCKKIAKVQRKNTDMMLKYNKGVDLINIFHGQTDKERSLYRSIVEDPEVPRVAIARVGWMTPVTGINAICETIEGQIRYKQYHVLGVYTNSYIPLLVKLANTGQNPVHITSDSTSHIQSAINKAYHHQFDTYHYMKRVPIGTRGSLISSARHLPCQCKVCTTLKYTDILGFGDNSITSELLAIHNAYEMARYARHMQDLNTSMTSSEYLELVKKQIGNKAYFPMVARALDFINIYAEDGLKAAQRKYSQELNMMKLAAKQVIPKKMPFISTEAVLSNNELEEYDPEIKRKRALVKIKEMQQQLIDRS